MKTTFKVRLEIIQKVLEGKMDTKRAAEILSCSRWTVNRYLRKFLEKGPKGLKDLRTGHNFKLTPQQRSGIRKTKEKGPWRSARFIRDYLNLPVHERTVWWELKKAGLNRLNYPGIKPLQRFEAKHANDLWQTDIMGRIDFPFLGICYLIATLDDKSRFCLSGRWFKRQSKLNVFYVWYQALSRWGLPGGMLSDKGSQFKPTSKKGETDYQHYARLLGINLVFAHKAQTKGKIERFWRFVQQDFVRENLSIRSLEALNGKFRLWLAQYNFKLKSRVLGGKTRAEVYQPSKRKPDQTEIKSLLTIEERRKVTRESIISLYGKTYRVPPGYINCRIWVKIQGNKVLFEAMNKTIWKQRLKL